MEKPPEVAAYIGEQCVQLQKMASGARLGLLAHLLETASLEATNQQIAALKTTAKSMRRSGGRKSKSKKAA